MGKLHLSRENRSTSLIRNMSHFQMKNTAGGAGACNEWMSLAGCKALISVNHHLNTYLDHTEFLS